MDKKQVNELLPFAQEVLAEHFGKEVSEEDRNKNNIKIPKEFRGYISTFGAAISTGSLVAAVAFISGDSNNTKGKREDLPGLILQVLVEGKEIQADTLFDYVTSAEEDRSIKENVLNATIALKLAMNLFELKEKK